MQHQESVIADTTYRLAGADSCFEYSIEIQYPIKTGYPV
jgi:hypothetical protein